MAHNTKQQEPVIIPEQRERAMRLLTGLGFDVAKFNKHFFESAIGYESPEQLKQLIKKCDIKINPNDNIDAIPIEAQYYLLGIMKTLLFFQIDSMI